MRELFVSSHTPPKVEVASAKSVTPEEEEPMARETLTRENIVWIKLKPQAQGRSSPGNCISHGPISDPSFYTGPNELRTSHGAPHTPAQTHNRFPSTCPFALSGPWGRLQTGSNLLCKPHARSLRSIHPLPHRCIPSSSQFLAGRKNSVPAIIPSYLIFKIWGKDHLFLEA